MMNLRQGLLWASMFCVAACGGDAEEKDPEEGTVQTLLTEALADAPGHEVRVLEVGYAPGQSTPAHHHAGQIIAYVLQGAVMSGLDGAAPTRFAQGQTWTEKQGQVHSSSNASATEPAKLLVFFVTAPGEPVLEPEE